MYKDQTVAAAVGYNGAFICPITGHDIAAQTTRIVTKNFFIIVFYLKWVPSIVLFGAQQAQWNPLPAC